MKRWTKLSIIALLAFTGCQSTPEEANQDSLALHQAESTAPDSKEIPLAIASADEQELPGLVRAPDLEPHPGAFEFTGRTRIKGVLQIYWHSYLETPENAPNRALGARFLVAEEQARDLAPFPDDPYDRTPSILLFHLGRDADHQFITGQEISRLAEELVTNVAEIPENFFPYQEGHVEQAGILTLEGLSSIIECDAPYTFVGFESFEPLPLTDETRAFTASVLAEPHRGGCGSVAPWEESFMLRDGQVIFAEPDENSEVVAEPSMPVVFKIRTINDDWMKVYSYPDPDVRGYVRILELEPVN